MQDLGLENYNGSTAEAFPYKVATVGGLGLGSGCILSGMFLVEFVALTRLLYISGGTLMCGGLLAWYILSNLCAERDYNYLELINKMGESPLVKKQMCRLITPENEKREKCARSKWKCNICRPPS